MEIASSIAANIPQVCLSQESASCTLPAPIAPKYQPARTWCILIRILLSITCEMTGLCSLLDRACMVVNDFPPLREALPDQRKDAPDVSFVAVQMPTPQH